MATRHKVNKIFFIIFHLSFFFSIFFFHHLCLWHTEKVLPQSRGVDNYCKVDWPPKEEHQSQCIFKFFFQWDSIFIYSIPEPTPSTMTALHQFGAEMLKLSRGLDAVSSIVAPMSTSSSTTCVVGADHANTELMMQREPLIQNRELPPAKLTRERNRWVFFSGLFLFIEICISGEKGRSLENYFRTHIELWAHIEQIEWKSKPTIENMNLLGLFQKKKNAISSKIDLMYGHNCSSHNETAIFFL